MRSKLKSLDVAGLLFPGAALQAETSSSGFKNLSQGRLQLALRGRNASQAARKEALSLVRMLMSTSTSALQQGLDTLSHLHYRPDAPSLINQVGPAPLKNLKVPPKCYKISCTCPGMRWTSDFEGMQCAWKLAPVNGKTAQTSAACTMPAKLASKYSRMV